MTDVVNAIEEVKHLQFSSNRFWYEAWILPENTVSGQMFPNEEDSH